MALHEYERVVLEYLKKQKKAMVKEIARATGLKYDAAKRASYWLSEKGLVKIEEKVFERVTLTEEGEKYLKEGFPEERVLEYNGKPISSLPPELLKVGLGKAKEREWVKIEGGKVVVVSKPQSYYLRDKLKQKIPDEELLKRKLIVVEKEPSYFVEITEKGERYEEKGEEGIGELSEEIIRSGEWKKGLKPFNLKMEKPYPAGKKHPLTIAIEKIKSIFRDLGFEEMEGGYVESSFWNFDALFVPQDHPARELQDTFYLDGESDEELDKGLIEKVKSIHERKWRYKWDFAEARRLLLRTHTTVLSARTLAKVGKKPGKFFAVGRVFRNEAIDFKHLAEFHQVEGIIVWKKATFRHLLGILKEFYSRLGFEKIRFRPSYFPYTEPSLEIEVYFEPRKEWIELGGAGIFRPELVKPLGASYPVLAWGLSLERPLMMLLNLHDIRTFYKNDYRWLENVSGRWVL